MKFLKLEKNSIILYLHVIPNAKENKVVDISGERCKIKIKAPPVDNKANTELIDFLAKMFGLAKKNVTIIQGEFSKFKTVLIEGFTIDIKFLVDKIRGINK